MKSSRSKRTFTSNPQIFALLLFILHFYHHDDLIVTAVTFTNSANPTEHSHDLADQQPSIVVISEETDCVRILEQEQVPSESNEVCTSRIPSLSLKRRRDKEIVNHRHPKRTIVIKSKLLFLQKFQKQRKNALFHSKSFSILSSLQQHQRQNSMATFHSAATSLSGGARDVSTTMTSGNSVFNNSKATLDGNKENGTVDENNVLSSQPEPTTNDATKSNNDVNPIGSGTLINHNQQSSPIISVSINSQLLKMQLQQIMQKVEYRCKDFIAEHLLSNDALTNALIQSIATSVPALLAIWSYKTKTGRQQLTFITMYALSLTGSSVGFYLFLYFISIGYATGIGLPAIAAMITYIGYARRESVSIPKQSYLHTLLVILWSIRSGVFFWWREYVNWPALHAKIVQVNKQKINNHQSPTLTQKIQCWVFYSFVYFCMASPCWFRLEQDFNTAVITMKIMAASNNAQPILSTVSSSFARRVTNTGILLQIFGLLLESVADWQKSKFKAEIEAATGTRMHWCKVGVWKYSTHPNYAGEWLFWLGTLLAAWWPAIVQNIHNLNNYSNNNSVGDIIFQNNIMLAVASVAMKIALMLIGFAFISGVLKNAAEKLGQKQYDKYGWDPEFLDFQNQYGIFGPKLVKYMVARIAIFLDQQKLNETYHSQNNGSNNHPSLSSALTKQETIQN